MIQMRHRIPECRCCTGEVVNAEGAQPGVRLASEAAKPECPDHASHTYAEPSSCCNQVNLHARSKLVRNHTCRNLPVTALHLVYTWSAKLRFAITLHEGWPWSCIVSLEKGLKGILQSTDSYHINQLACIHIRPSRTYEPHQINILYTSKHWDLRLDQMWMILVKALSRVSCWHVKGVFLGIQTQETIHRNTSLPEICIWNELLIRNIEREVRTYCRQGKRNREKDIGWSNPDVPEAWM